MLKNFISRKMFGMSYDSLPLASEIICDLQCQVLRYKILTLSISAVLLITLLTACEVIANV